MEARFLDLPTSRVVFPPKQAKGKQRSGNPMNNTPMHAAIAGAAGESLAPLLIAVGADVHAVGGSGVTALHLAASRGFESLCRLLLARGVDRSLKTEDEKTPAEIARERGHLATAAALELN